MSVRPAIEADVPALLPLVRAYADFYESVPPDAGLERMCRALIADPNREGVLLAACDADERVVGFAAMSWKWSSLRGAKVGWPDSTPDSSASVPRPYADRTPAPVTTTEPVPLRTAIKLPTES